MRLFGQGDKSDRHAGDAAAQAELDRLVALAPPELGAEMMAAFGPDGAKAKGKLGVAPMQIIEWLMRSIGRGVGTKPLVPVVLAALQTMQHAGLPEARGSGTGTGTNTYRLTPLGETALREGTAGAYLSP